MEELHSCISERRGRRHAALMSVNGGVIDVIVLKLRRPSVLRREGLAPFDGGGLVVRISAAAAAAVLTEKKLPLQIFPTAANKIQMPEPELFVPDSFPPSLPPLPAPLLAPSLLPSRHPPPSLRQQPPPITLVLLCY